MLKNFFLGSLPPFHFDVSATNQTFTVDMDAEPEFETVLTSGGFWRDFDMKGRGFPGQAALLERSKLSLEPGAVESAFPDVAAMMRASSDTVELTWNAELVQLTLDDRVISSRGRIHDQPALRSRRRGKRRARDHADPGREFAERQRGRERRRFRHCSLRSRGKIPDPHSTKTGILTLRVSASLVDGARKSEPHTRLFALDLRARAAQRDGTSRLTPRGGFAIANTGGISAGAGKVEPLALAWPSWSAREGCSTLRRSALS